MGLVADDWPHFYMIEIVISIVVKLAEICYFPNKFN